MKIEVVIKTIEIYTIKLNEKHRMITMLPNVKSMAGIPNNYGS